MKDKHGVTRQVVLYLRKHLEDGTWPVGSKIPPEKALCQQTGASRTSVRSALQQFNVLGLLESRHGSGTFVRSNNVALLGGTAGPEEAGAVSMDYLWEWNETRFILEPRIAYYAAERATPELVEKLEQLNEAQRAAVGDQDAFIRADAAFHMTLVDALGNSYLSGLLREMWMEEISRQTNYTMGYYGGVYFHAAITDAIRRHDAAKAQQIMEEHALDRLSILKGEKT